MFCKVLEQVQPVSADRNLIGGAVWGQPTPEGQVGSLGGAVVSWFMVVVLTTQVCTLSLFYHAPGGTLFPATSSQLLFLLVGSSPLNPSPVCTSPRESPSSDSEDDSWTLEEGRERPCRGDADGVLDSSSLSPPGTCSLAGGTGMVTLGKASSPPVPLPIGLQGAGMEDPDPGSVSPQFHPPRISLCARPSPCVILADTISVICEVSFCRNSSVPTSARDRWPQASAARGSPGGQTLAQPACTPDEPEHPFQACPELGVQGRWGHTVSGLCCWKQRGLTRMKSLNGSQVSAQTRGAGAGHKGSGWPGSQRGFRALGQSS